MPIITMNLLAFTVNDLKANRRELKPDNFDEEDYIHLSLVDRLFNLILLLVAVLFF